MNYDNCVITLNEGCAVAKNDIPMSAMLDEASALSYKILDQVYQINGHMFAPAADVCKDSKNPSCFKEALDMHVSTLRCITNGLESLMKQLGV